VSDDASSSGRSKDGLFKKDEQICNGSDDAAAAVKAAASPLPLRCTTSGVAGIITVFELRKL
jgi:hypothetical protein